MKGTKKTSPFAEKGPAKQKQNSIAILSDQTPIVNYCEKRLPVRVIDAFNRNRAWRCSCLLKSVQSTFFTQETKNVGRSFLPGLSTASVLLDDQKSGVIRS